MGGALSGGAGAGLVAFVWAVGGTTGAVRTDARDGRGCKTGGIVPNRPQSRVTSLYAFPSWLYRASLSALRGKGAGVSVVLSVSVGTALACNHIAALFRYSH